MREVQSENMYTVLWERYIWFSSNSSIIKSKITLTFNFDQMHYIYKEGFVFGWLKKFFLLFITFFFLLLFFFILLLLLYIIFYLLLLIQYLISAEEEEEEEKKKKN